MPLTTTMLAVLVPACVAVVADSERLPSAAAHRPGETVGAAGVPGIGPDVIIGDLQRVVRFGRVGDITAYAVGTTSCNIGDERASWVSYTNEHPVISQSMFRLRRGCFEQIGMSWVKHGFYAVSQSLCTPCNDPTDGRELGVGCSDPYSAHLNGVQGNMSLRSEVNPHTGYFPYPWTAPEPPETIGKRLQVHDADLDPDLNSGALYFVDGHYVTADDAAAGNGNNNASYRPVLVTELTEHDYGITVTGQTQREQPAIRAWQDTDPSVVETDVQVPDDGLFIVAAKASEIGLGFWRYEYAAQNLNADRACGSFTVPLPSGVLLGGIDFHDVDYHSGSPYDGTDWSVAVTDGKITWSTADESEAPDANALRWGTVYNFRLQANAAPGPVMATLKLFKRGVPPRVTAVTIGPGGDRIDCNQNGLADACELDCGGNGCMAPCGFSPDCNVNGVPDPCDVSSGTSPDDDGDGIPDECEGVLGGDLDYDLDVDLGDYRVLVDSCFVGPGSPPGPLCEAADFDGDADVDLRDFAGFQIALTGR